MICKFSTPERIEFENSIDLAQEETEELQAIHNLVSTLSPTADQVTHISLMLAGVVRVRFLSRLECMAGKLKKLPSRSHSREFVDSYREWGSCCQGWLFFTHHGVLHSS